MLTRFTTVVSAVRRSLGPAARCARFFGVDSIDGFFDLSTWIAAIIGSVILLALYRLAFGSRRSHRHA